MHTTIGSILLNEAEFIELSLRQHYAYADKIVLIEGADKLYPSDLVTKDGLSTDDTAEIIRSFPDPDKKIEFVQYGFAENKAVLRNEYAKRTEPGILLAVDCDEFLSNRSWELVKPLLEAMSGPGALRIKHVHAWKDYGHVVRGLYYDVPHLRLYRWPKKAGHFTCHNHPMLENGTPLYKLNCLKIEAPWHDLGGGVVGMRDPFWFHAGFARQAHLIAAKNAYYRARGESQTRPDTTRARAAWFAEETPSELTISKFNGPYPEVFQNGC